MSIADLCGVAHFFSPGVFDGHAGYAAAQFLQNNLYNVFNEMIDTHSLGLDCNIAERTEGLCCPLHLHGVLTDCYTRADSALLTWLAEQSDDQCESGCTATTALVCNDRIIVANVGDSRAVLCRNGESIDLSTEHRVCGRGPAVGSEIARIKSAGGWIEEGRVCGILAVSRAFGDSNFKGEGLKRLLAQGTEDGYWDDSFASSVTFTANPVIAEPDVFEIGLLSGQDEFLIVATDGLWDVMSSKEVVKVARSDFLQGRHPQEVAQRLASFALKRYTADNVAVVVIDLSGQEKWKMDGEKTKASKGLFGLWKP
jgi:serine/threonine protein phosphatase PrpC